MDELIKKALTTTRESKFVEFKEHFDIDSAGDWCELIKDIVALTNSGGGVILIGLDNHGNPNKFDVSSILRFDPADITNKVYKYTGWQFSDFEISEQYKEGCKVAALRIQGMPVPIVFTKPGTYDIGGGKQKTAFSTGTIYFRHGAKSEPGNTEDIKKVIERQIESIRKEWLSGVRKVVTAPKGSKVLVIPGKAKGSSTDKATPIRIVDDPSALAVRLTQDSGSSMGILLHEELQDGLFDEINNVLNANTLLAKSQDKFLLGAQVYYRIYAERQHVRPDINQLMLLALTGLKEIYGPALYWLLRLPASACAKVLYQMCINPKAPNVRTVIRLMILLGPDATHWLYDLWDQKWSQHTQKPDFYWTLKKIVEQRQDLDRRVIALRTIMNISNEVSNDEGKYTVNDLMDSPQLASSYLSKECIRVFDGDKNARSLCRYLDIIAYGQELESQARDIIRVLTTDVTSILEGGPVEQQAT